MAICEALYQWFLIGEDLVLRGQLAVSGVIFGCQDWGTGGGGSVLLAPSG